MGCCSVQLTRQRKSKLACWHGCATHGSVIVSRQITQGFAASFSSSATSLRVRWRISCRKSTSSIQATCQGWVVGGSFLKSRLSRLSRSRRQNRVLGSSVTALARFATSTLFISQLCANFLSLFFLIECGLPKRSFQKNSHASALPICRTAQEAGFIAHRIPSPHYGVGLL